MWLHDEYQQSSDAIVALSLATYYEINLKPMENLLRDCET